MDDQSEFFERDLFSWRAEPVPAPERKTAGKRLCRAELQQLALGFLFSLRPAAAAAMVSVSRVKNQVCGAGFWRKPGRSREIEKTAVVVLYDKVEHCFRDCRERDVLLAEIQSLRVERERLEAVIRREEPELASKDDLFVELRSWDYASSVNPEYQELRRRIGRLQKTLLQGSRLEHVRNSKAADLCYLAVPENMISPDEIVEGWGVVYLKSDRSFEIVREAVAQEVVADNRMMLVQNIAVAARRQVAFACGIDPDGKKIAFRKPPRRRKRW